MAAAKKTAIVSKKVSDIQLKNHERWEAFVANCLIPWEDLNDSWKDFYCEMGNTESSEIHITKAIGVAMKGDVK
jgi:hypothetical protein